MSTPSAVRELTIAQAVNEAFVEELRRDERVFVIGEDVAEAGTPFKVLAGLVEEFGPERIVDSPISEAGIAGLGVGAAMTGLRPVVDIMFGDFLTLVMDQLANQAAKTHYMSGGKLSVPLVLRTTLGATRRSAAQHSQSLQAWVAHIPGLKVVLPSTPYDAKGLLKSAIRDDNPVVFLHHYLLTLEPGEVPDGEHLVPFGKAEIRRAGGDLTIVATGWMVPRSLAAAEKLAQEGIQAEVIDPRTVAPLDLDTILKSVAKTGRLVLVDQAPRHATVSGIIAGEVAEHGFSSLKAPIVQVTARDATVPYSEPLEAYVIPDEERIMAAARRVLQGRR